MRTEKYGEIDGVFGDHHFYSMKYSQQNQVLISRKDFHDINLNFASNVM